MFTKIAIMDELGNFCEPNIPGEIVIKGPGVMVRYWDDPETTAKTLVDGWLHTGDLGVVDADGLLTMQDRLKDIIISGGINISAAELERVVSELQGVMEVAVISAKDDKFGETPLAVVYGNAALKAADIIAVDLSSLDSQPCYDVISQLVYATGRDKVSDVWVGGVQLLKDRQLTTLNKTKIIQNTHDWANKIRQSDK